MTNLHDSYGAPVDTSVDPDFPYAGKTPQPYPQRITTRAAAALDDPSLSPSELEGLAQEVENYGNLQRDVANVGIGAAAEPAAEGVAIAAGLLAEARYASLGGTLVREGQAPLSGSALLSHVVSKYTKVGALFGVLAGIVTTIEDPAAALGLGDEEEVLAEADRVSPLAADEDDE